MAQQRGVLLEEAPSTSATHIEDEEDAEEEGAKEKQEEERPMGRTAAHLAACEQKSLLLTEMHNSVIGRIQRIYYPILAAVGVLVNLVAIVILSRGKCGLSKCISRYLVGMAVADLLVVIIEVILGGIIPFYLPVSLLDITPVCSFIAALCAAATVVSVWFTVAFTFDRFVAICWEKLKIKYCTERTAAVVLGTVSVLGCLLSVPWYFMYTRKYIIDNVPWRCATKWSFRASPTWAAFEMIDLILTPCVPVCLILLFNVLTVRRILVSSRVRRGLRGRSNGENHKDPEMENRKKSIILLFSISGSFILLWLTNVVFYIYARIADTQYYSSYTDPIYITEHTSKMLQLLSSCTNTCIYVLTQTKFREELKNAVKYPLNLIVKLIDGSGSSQSITEDEETEKVTPGGAEDVRDHLIHRQSVNLHQGIKLGGNEQSGRFQVRWCYQEVKDGGTVQLTKRQHQSSEAEKEM
ncbi:probable G-protein coupled receptor 139 [Heptranchias perlo]|uniref:probable G-protein coupled receptor 139 n=1 Tax=Heptranchias perlo TaxID=212740 RepID=UPI003559B48E